MAYIVKTKSKEGIYYLVNGWNKSKAFFTDKVSSFNEFSSIKTAKSNITKIKNIGKKYDMDYQNDKYIIIDTETGKEVYKE